MKKAKTIYHYIYYYLLVTRVKSEQNSSFQSSMLTEKKLKLWVCTLVLTVSILVTSSFAWIHSIHESRRVLKVKGVVSLRYSYGYQTFCKQVFHPSLCWYMQCLNSWCCGWLQTPNDVIQRSEKTLNDPINSFHNTKKHLLCFPWLRYFY